MLMSVVGENGPPVPGVNGRLSGKQAAAALTAAFSSWAGGSELQSHWCPMLNGPSCVTGQVGFEFCPLELLGLDMASAAVAAVTSSFLVADLGDTLLDACGCNASDNISPCRFAW
jgi:hypothetical protein